ncbi:MAG: primosomal protein N' [Proteobacteria bacterium]|nr:primosomal protein N' [Pseudomonadota bacterium]
MKLVEVAVAAPIHSTLTYSVPEKLSSKLCPGVRLLVPLSGRIVTGYALGPVVQTSEKYQIKPVIDVLDALPLFPESMIPFYRWVASYYLHPIGEVIKSGLPAGLSPQSKRNILLTSKGEEHFQDVQASSEIAEASWLNSLIAKKKLAAAEVRKLWRSKARNTLEQMAAEGLISINDDLSGDATKIKKEVCVCLAENHLAIINSSNLLVSENKTLGLINELGRETSLDWIPRKDISRKYSGARSAIKKLADRGILIIKDRQIYRDPFGDPPHFYPAPEYLSNEQEIALEAISNTLSKRKFQPFLLHGVTGSGKTEVYLKAAERVLKQGRSVLVLVPEIALASQLEAHFFSRFGDNIAVLHSGLSQGERFDQWMRLVKGDAKIVIGARSAIFAPLGDVGLIVVDEEHDGSYKQEDGLRYQARDLAVLRGSMQQAVVILGSATPAVTSFYNARKGKYKLLELQKRIADRQLPKVQSIDLKGIKTVSGRPPLFSNELITSLKKTYESGDQSLIFLNRRGFSNLMLCRDCGRTLQCDQCNITMTLHKGRKELICHYCGSTSRSDIICPSCHSTQLVGVGFGTERIESELKDILPGATIARLDRDTAVKRKDYLDILKAVRDRTIDVLIGTQMITKGHHFPHVTLVGVVWGDSGLGLPDFKAGERTFQLLSQVTGRAGRGDKPGRVIIQTHQPHHYSIVSAQSHDYNSMYEKEIDQRQKLGFPPFSRLVNFRISGEHEEEVKKTVLALSQTVKKMIVKLKNMVLLGPAPAPLSRLRGQYRWQFLLKGVEIDKIQAVCRGVYDQLPPAIRSGKLKLAVDVDPESML